jgi:hypothetical protein
MCLCFGIIYYIVGPLSVHVPKHPRVLEFTRGDHDWKATAEFNLRVSKIPEKRKLRSETFLLPRSAVQLQDSPSGETKSSFKAPSFTPASQMGVAHSAVTLGCATLQLEDAINS